MDPMAAIKVTFFQECEDQLAELENGLMAMEAGDSDSETVNAVFRAVHSVKGGAGAFSLDDLVRFAHVFETALDDVRAGRLALTPDVIRLMLRAADVLADLVRAARDDGAVDEAACAALAAELAALSGGGEAADDDDGMGDIVFQPLQVSLGDAPPMLDDAPALPSDVLAMLSGAPAVETGRTCTIRFTPTADLYAKANEATLLLRELGRLGEMSVTLDASRLPPLDALDPEGAYLSWTVELATRQPEQSVREVFEFVEGDCELDIRCQTSAAPPGEAAKPDLDISALLSKARAEPEPTAPAPEAAAPDLDIMALIAKAQAAPAEVAEAAKAPVRAAPAAVEHPAESAAKVEAVAPAQTTIRVDLPRVDRLIDLVGELVINQAMLSQRVLEAGIARTSGVAMALDELEQLTREIQDSVMAIRAQPVKSVFQRMPRLVREISSMTGKAVRLVTEGEGAEVDKMVIERLVDPLTHMVRNAIDHGLESPEGRAKAGKPAEGVVKLSALHRSGRIVIEVSDDGGGINRPRVKQIAAEKGLIAQDAPLSDDEIDNLIFLPGFSTADTVSDISGRGVGMDVVRRSIQAIGGRISITSKPGLGSTFTLSLPLTLAVLDGMVVSVADQTLVTPLSAIIETLQPKPADVHWLGGDARVIAIRDSYVPLVDVGQALGFRSEPQDAASGVALLIEGEGGSRAALLVDGIQGQRQVVIKSLEANYGAVPGIAAATVLGDGRVALILDADAIVSVSRAETARSESRSQDSRSQDSRSQDPRSQDPRLLAAAG